MSIGKFIELFCRNCRAEEVALHLRTADRNEKLINRGQTTFKNTTHFFNEQYSLFLVLRTSEKL